MSTVLQKTPETFKNN